jgi:hypothetical protein
MKTELIQEAPEATPPQLAIVHRTFGNRRSKRAKGEGDRSKLKTNSKVTRVSLTRMAQRRVRGSNPPEFKDVRVETEVLAEFEGPTGEDAARDFIKLLQLNRTKASGKTCLADGAVPPPSEALDGRTGNLPPHRLN